MDTPKRFCTECGMQLAAEDTACPVCGTKAKGSATGPAIQKPDPMQTPVIPDAPTITAAPSIDRTPPVQKDAAQAPITQSLPAEFPAVGTPGGADSAPAPGPLDEGAQVPPPAPGQYSATAAPPPAGTAYPQAGYSTPPASAPMGGAGYGQGGYSAPPPPQHPAPWPGNPAMQMAAPPKKSNAKTLVIVLLVMVVVAALGLVGYNILQGNSLRNEYAALVTDISGARTAEDVAGYSSDLDALYAADSTLVDSDVYNYVKLCSQYVGARESAGLYEDTLDELDSLLGTDVDGLRGGVQSVYDQIDASYGIFLQERQTQVQGGFDFDPLTFSPGLEITSEVDVDILEGEWGFSFSALNISDKEIEYFEFWIFCFDEYGFEVWDEYNENWDWDYVYINLAPGESHTPEEHGYWYLYFEGDEISMVYPYISYVEYADGSTEGVSLYDALEDDGLESAYYDYIATVGEQAGDWAASQAA